MSDTPETDHIEDQLGSAAKFSHPVIWRHARQLERERDAAIEHWEEVQEYGADEINAAVDLRQKLAQALVELDNMQDQRDLAMKVISRLERERDEAREALMKIEDLFIDGTDIYADREKMGMIAREALEDAK